MFAAAPYIGFLAPVAALSVGLPFIIGCAVFSVVTIALSYAAVSKNKTISEKDVQLAEKVEEISKKDAQLAKEEDKVQAQKQTISELEAKIQTQKQTISEKDAQLSEKEKEISEKDAKLVDQAKEIEELKRGNAFVPQAMKDIQTASEKAFTSTKEAFISGRVTRIVKDGLKDVYGAMPSTESVKGTLSGIGNKLKNGCGTSVGYTMGTLGSAKETFVSGVKKVYNAMPSVESVNGTFVSGVKSAYNAISSAESIGSRVPSLKTIAEGAGLAGGIAYVTANGGFDVAVNSSNAIGNPINGTKGGVPILTSVFSQDLLCNTRMM